MPCKKSRLDAGAEATLARRHLRQIRKMMPMQGSLIIERMCELVRIRTGFYRSLQQCAPHEESMEVRSAIQRVALEHRRPANLYDNASCESFVKTLKREEICANQYRNLDHLRSNIEEFIERYYNQKRLHSALCYRSPEEFEQDAQRESEATKVGATVRFFPPSKEKASTLLAGEGTPSPSLPQTPSLLENQ